MGSAKGLGLALLATFAVPAAGLSGIGAIGALIGMLLSHDNRTSGVFTFFVVAVVICFLSIRLLVGMHKKAKGLVESINLQSNLNFNAENLLGYPSPAFLIFDKQNRKLAFCNSSTGHFKIYELSYLLAWRYEWKIKESMELSGPGRQVGTTNMQMPSFERVQRAGDFSLILEVADESNPVIKFYMSERAAKEWCAKLNAIVNG
ncbi:hypothetical protein ACO0LC_24845 [Undibacterium sp. JH2W]|uniref:hypothetical protein n=1 Tax=Undibacterium sp. JH2W TaxID=3413037 RepID=UPI003BF31FEF